MAWTEIEPLKTPPGTTPKAPMTIACTRPGRFAGRILIAMRDAPAWFAPGKGVRCYLGTEGRQSGMLRIAPNGPHVVSKSGGGRGQRKTINPRLSLPLFPGVKHEHRLRQPVAFELVDGGIEVKLPSWAIAQTPPEARAAAFRTAATSGRAPVGIAGGR